MAWYAPEAESYDVTAKFIRPKATMAVTTNVLLTLEESRMSVIGGFDIAPEFEKVFAFDFSVPKQWQITEVKDGGDQPLQFEQRPGSADTPDRIHVRLKNGIAPNAAQPFRVVFTAVSQGEGWLSQWDSHQVEFPVFAIEGASSDIGALAVSGRTRHDASPRCCHTPCTARRDDA